MIRDYNIRQFDLIMTLSQAVDLVSPAVANHHIRVAYIAHSIGNELGLPTEQKNSLALAGALHDIGALSLRSRLDALEFELKNPHGHAELGYRFLAQYPKFF